MTTKPRTSDIPQEYLQAIGRVVVNFAKLESMLTHCLVIVLSGNTSSSGKGLVVFSEMNVVQKMNALESLLALTDHELCIIYRTEIKTLINKAKDERNETLHQSWIIHQDEVKRMNISARKELKVTFHPVDLERLYAVSALSEEAADKLFVKIAHPIVERAQPHEGQ